MGDFIMTMDERSDISGDSDDGDTGFAFDFTVRQTMLRVLFTSLTTQFNSKA